MRIGGKGSRFCIRIREFNFGSAPARFGNPTRQLVRWPVSARRRRGGNALIIIFGRQLAYSALVANEGGAAVTVRVRNNSRRAPHEAHPLGPVHGETEGGAATLFRKSN